MTEPTFRTFCHISDYNEHGYANLHRLVAGSQPLLLWSPSSVLLKAHGSITPRDYVTLVEHGIIRIIGRENWLLDRRARDTHRWPGAQWDNYIDDAIHRIYINDLHEPDVLRRRVIIAEKEPGQSWAEWTVATQPEQIEFWRQVLSSADVEDRIPPGTLEAIQTQELNAEAAAIRILRDARNHGQAVEDSHAETPFLLSRSDRMFLKILSDTRIAAEDGTGAHVQVPHQRVTLADNIADELASQLLHVLERLDESRGENSLMRFITGDGHKELVGWIVELKQLFAGSAGPADGALVRALLAKIENSGRDSIRSALFAGALVTFGTGVGAVELANTVSQAAEQMNLSNILGLALAAISGGIGTLKLLGYVGGAYSDPQWPYLYTGGKKATRSRRRLLIDNLRSP